MTTQSDDLATDETREPRHVQELLKLDSYQGMTDAEITSLMEYKAAIAAVQAKEQALQQANEQLHTELLQQASEAAERAQAAFDAAVKSTVAFEKVSA